MKIDSGILRRCAAGMLVLFGGYALADDAGSKLPADVIVEQGGVQITLQDIDAFARKIPESDRAGFFDSPKRIESVLTNMLLRKQLAKDARADKLDQDALIRRQMDQSADEVLANAEVDRHRAALKIPEFDALAHEYYLTHKDEYVTPAVVDVKHVLVSTKERSDSEAKARIGEVEAAARAHPDQFDALVEKYSDDPSKTDNHGLIANAVSGKAAKPFTEAAKALRQPGEISPVVKTTFGYHVLKLESRKPETQMAFADVRAQIVKKLRDNYISKEMDQYTGEIRGRPLESNPDLVAGLRTRYVAPGTMLPSEVVDAAAHEDTSKQQSDGKQP
jgi:parvulin-like peptidyl-prolyl isomerase